MDTVLEAGSLTPRDPMLFASSVRSTKSLAAEKQAMATCRNDQIDVSLATVRSCITADRA